MTNSKIAEIIDRRYQKIREFTDPIIEQKQLNRALYNQEYYPELDETDYALSDPYTFMVVRNYISRCNPAHTEVFLDPTNEFMYESKEVNQKFTNWELRELQMTMFYVRLLYSGFINGKAFFNTSWLYEPAVEINEKGEDGEVVRNKIMRNMVNRATASFTRFEDVFVPNQNIPRLRDQPYYLKHVNKTVGEMMEENEALLEQGLEAYWDEKWLKDLKKKGVDKKILDYQMDFPDESEISKEEMALKSANVAMLCMHTQDGDVYYLPFEGGGNGVSRKIINKDTTNKYWHGHYPDADFSPFPEDDTFYPQALVDVFADLQIAASELLNLGLTNIRQGTFQMWIAGTPSAQTPDWMFRTRPDGIIRVVGDPTQIQPIRVVDNSRSTMNMAQEVGQRIEKGSGISSLYASGAGNQQVNQTARGAQILDQNIDTNVQMVRDNLSEQVVKVIAEDFMELNAQYVTEEQTFNVTGKMGLSELVKIAPEQVSANFNVSVNQEMLKKQTPASKQASIQNTSMILQNMSNQSQGALQIDMAPIAEALVHNTPEMENVSGIVVSVDEKGKRDIMMLERGQMPEIKVRDPHMELIQMVSVHFDEILVDESIAQLFEKYVEKHLKYIQSEQEIQAMSQPQIPGGMGAGGLEQAMMGGGGEQMGPDQAGVEGQGYNLDTIV
jgi:hypothetical protein